MNNVAETNAAAFYTHFKTAGGRCTVEGRTIAQLEARVRFVGAPAQKLPVYRVGDAACERVAYIQV